MDWLHFSSADGLFLASTGYEGNGDVNGIVGRSDGADDRGLTMRDPVFVILGKAQQTQQQVTL